MQEDSDPDSRARTILRELGIYLVYIVITCILAFTMVSPTSYRYTSALRSAMLDSPIRPTENDFDTFADIAAAEDVWDWLENPFSATLFPVAHYNGEPLTTYEAGFVLEDSMMLGIPRLRTLKVKNNSCEVPSDFADDIYDCFAAYAPDKQDESRQFPASIYSNGTDLTNESAWVFSSQDELGGAPYDAVVSTYSGGGFFQDLYGDASLPKQLVQELKASRWITEGTRVLFADFSVYNANINLFCVVKVVFEFPAAGGVVASDRFQTMRLIRYIDDFDYFVLACEIVFCTFVLYYTIEEILEIKHMGLYNYLSCSIWSMLDITILVFSYVAILFNIYRYFTVENKLPGLIARGNEYADFETLAYWQEHYNILIAVTVFLSWIKVFKYLSFNRTMTQMTQTLSQCANDLLGYTVMFFIVFFSYAQLGYLVFGSSTFGFHTFEDSVFTLFRIVLGDFDFYALQQSHRVFGPLYFITYVFFVFFILINVFLAIINDSYTKVKEDLDMSDEQYEVSRYVASLFSSILRLKKRESVADGGDDDAKLRTASSDDKEVEEARVSSTKASNQAQSPIQTGESADFAQMQARVDKLEQAMGTTISKIDTMLVHLENIELAQRIAAGLEPTNHTEKL